MRHEVIDQYADIGFVPSRCPGFLATYTACSIDTGDQALRDAAGPALCFTLERQRDDGAWYYGEYREGEPYDRGMLLPRRGLYISTFFGENRIAIGFGLPSRPRNGD